ncbi:hypothetical protein DMP23_00830 [Amycolatopsis sp. A1MSW2902]
MDRGRLLHRGLDGRADGGGVGRGGGRRGGRGGRTRGGAGGGRRGGVPVGAGAGAGGASERGGGRYGTPAQEETVRDRANHAVSVRDRPRTPPGTSGYSPGSGFRYRLSGFVTYL